MVGEKGRRRKERGGRRGGAKEAREREKKGKREEEAEARWLTRGGGKGKERDGSVWGEALNARGADSMVAGKARSGREGAKRARSGHKSRHCKQWKADRGETRTKQP
ncbi:hypothetical protein BIFGAL_03471 [Bifidobacterium gallicum DSM 20093 = LMG 11596]|uniref:Uncharacterized protein n=1 Tax=Bifidobacterium gallicum DSM 20093 = LMG 11596 TaxID=561180 RepID=D1NUE8_9BIFI|nr:hypothetical protein BIFGAL_03471 [Bifidobacterium gallicum DSM 20093 = LMG 11596]